MLRTDFGKCFSRSAKTNRVGSGSSYSSISEVLEIERIKRSYPSISSQTSPTPYRLSPSNSRSHLDCKSPRRGNLEQQDYSTNLAVLAETHTDYISLTCLPASEPRETLLQSRSPRVYSPSRNISSHASLSLPSIKPCCISA